MKFKVGDKVRILQNPDRKGTAEHAVGDVGIVTEVVDDGEYQVRTDCLTGFYWHEGDLELADNPFKVGVKYKYGEKGFMVFITERNGVYFSKISEEEYTEPLKAIDITRPQDYCFRDDDCKILGFVPDVERGRILVVYGNELGNVDVSSYEKSSQFIVLKSDKEEV